MLDIIQKNTWAVILLAVLVSFGFPVLGYGLAPYLNIFLMGIMFLSCLDIDLGELKREFKNLKRQSLILFSSQLIGPIIVLFLKPFLSEELFLGLILASAIPIGRSSVFLAKIFEGDTTAPLILSSISNALSPITVPFLVLLFAKTSIRINPMEMGRTILWLVLVPIILAILARSTGKINFLIKKSSGLSIILLFLIIIGIIAPLRATILTNWIGSISLMILVAILMVVNFWFGWNLGRDKKEKIGLAITASYKNYTLGTLVALSMFSPIVALPSIIYTITNNLMLIPIQFFIERKK
jgi:BASS family bile acid:Na+ symporter